MEPCPGEIFSEQRPIFFPITAAVPAKLAYLLAEAHRARSASRDEEGGVSHRRGRLYLVTRRVLS